MPQTPRLLRFPAPPQLEVIHAGDDTIRAELIALPVIRAEAVDAGAAAGIGHAPDAAA